MVVGIGQQRILTTSEAEIDQFQSADLGDDRIGCFQIAVNDTVIVRVGQCVGGFDAVSHELLDWEDGLSESIAQGPSVNELHRDKRLPARFADLVYRADVRVI